MLQAEQLINTFCQIRCLWNMEKSSIQVKLTALGLPQYWEPVNSYKIAADKKDKGVYSLEIYTKKRDKDALIFSKVILSDEIRNIIDCLEEFCIKYKQE